MSCLPALGHYVHDLSFTLNVIKCKPKYQNKHSGALHEFCSKSISAAKADSTG